MQTEAKVGIAVIFGAALLILLLGRVGKWSSGDADGLRLHALFDNVAGLELKSPVQVAGVKVGEVETINLKDGKADVGILLYKGVTVYRGARAAVRSTGLLGEKYLEMVGGNPELGPLSEGELVGQYASSGDMDRLINSITKVAEDLGSVTETLREALGTPEGREQVKSIVRYIHDFTEALSERGPLVMDRLDHILAQIEDGVGTLGKLVNDPGAYDELTGTLSDLKAVMAKVRAGEGSLGRLVNDDALYNNMSAAAQGVRDVTDKATHGDGTIGRLLNEDSTINSINSAMKSVSQLGNKFGTMRTFVTFSNEYQTDFSQSKGYFGLRLDPGGKRDYVLEVVQDPAGRTRWGTATVTVGGVPTTTEVLRTDRKFMVSAMFSQEFGPLELHGGLVESTGGAGVRLHAFGPLNLSVNAWDFDSVKVQHGSPHLKATARVDLGRYLFVQGGVDNALNSLYQTPFVGAGLTFEDEDIKYLLGAASLN
ncbi:MAG: MlaD family protein [Nitrospirota bacterium]|nr:MlaD family protein [Nitrospirota bacterium]